MYKYDKIRQIGHPETDGVFDEDGELVIQEKVDGANFRFHIDNEVSITYGSRNVSYDGVECEDIPKNFKRTIEYVEETVDTDVAESLVTETGPFTVFGESMHPHLIEYDWKETPRFIGFDVRLNDSEMYCDPVVALNTIEQLGLHTISVIDRIDPNEFDVEEYAEPESAYRDGTAEGIVVKNTKTNVRMKSVTEQFEEKHDRMKSRTRESQMNSDAERMANRYTGDDNQRIRKTIHKLTDEGYELDMSLMEQLGPRIIEDIAVEEADEFILENWTVDFHEFRKHVNRLCVRTLQSMLENESDDK
jgi:ATP-dependent RNA circularization protein (DNA/RNA ligase family)